MSFDMREGIEIVPKGTVTIKEAFETTVKLFKDLQKEHGLLQEQSAQLIAHAKLADKDILGAKAYLESCGYHKLEPIDTEPEYYMWRSFKEYQNSPERKAIEKLIEGAV